MRTNLDSRAGKVAVHMSRFFGGGGFPGFGGFGGMGDEEEQTPKGHDVHVELEVTLKDLYLGHQYKVGTSQRRRICPVPLYGICRTSCYQAWR